MRVHDANCDVLHQCDECQRMMQIAHSPIPLEALAQIAQLQARVAALTVERDDLKRRDDPWLGWQGYEIEKAKVAALTAERDASVEKARQWAIRAQESIDRLAALTAAAEALLRRRLKTEMTYEESYDFLWKGQCLDLWHKLDDAVRGVDHCCHNPDDCKWGGPGPCALKCPYCGRGLDAARGPDNRGYCGVCGQMTPCPTHDAARGT